jgi:hypothetical protein
MRAGFDDVVLEIILVEENQPALFGDARELTQA